MATYHFWRRLLDEDGKAIIGAEVNVYLASTTTSANIYNGTEEVLANPVITDNTGMFEFYIRDYSESGGYAATQKFKLSWLGENQDGEAISGDLDKIDIYPNIFQVDETDEINSSFNKVISNDLAYDWNNHVVETYENEVHNMVEIDYSDSVDMTPNKLVSNYFMNQMWSSLASAQSPTVETTGAAITTISVGLSGSGDPVKWINSEADWESHETWPSDVQAWAAICWSPELSIFCATAWGDGGNEEGRVMTSPDGTNWTPATAAATNRWFGLCWSPELSIFCAVSDTGTNDRVMTSPDGINWTSRDASLESQWISICWSPELSIFCAVSSGNKIMTSPDGTNWTDRTSPAAITLQAICWSPELSIFCAVARSGTGNRVITSPNGIDWTWRVSAADISWYSVCWSPELSLFCAVSWDGTDRVMTSPDGTNWTIQTSIAGQWYDIAWSPEKLAFVAVAVDGKSMVSYNGIDWTEKTIATGAWWSICWSPELSLFCAVHYSGATDRAITLSGEFITYYADIEHSLNIEHPVVVLFEASGAEYQPWKVESTDSTPPYNTIRVFSTLDVKTEVTVIG